MRKCLEIRRAKSASNKKKLFGDQVGDLARLRDFDKFFDRRAVHVELVEHVELS